MTFRTKRPHGRGWEADVLMEIGNSNSRPQIPALNLKNRSQTDSASLFSLISCVFYPSENERYARASFDSGLYFQTIILPISPSARLKRSFPGFGFRLMLFSFFRFPKNPLAERHALVKTRFVFIKETSRSPRFIRLYYENDQGQDVVNLSWTCGRS